MNERIKELAEQAEQFVIAIPGLLTLAECDELYDQKFAELIVGECMTIVKSNTYGPNGEYDYSYSDESAAADERAETIYKEIAYSFGVEE
jgi:hypothetical protein